MVGRPGRGGKVKSPRPGRPPEGARREGSTLNHFVMVKCASTSAGNAGRMVHANESHCKACSPPTPSNIDNDSVLLVMAVESRAIGHGIEVSIRLTELQQATVALGPVGRPTGQRRGLDSAERRASSIAGSFCAAISFLMVGIDLDARGCSRSQQDDTEAKGRQGLPEMPRPSRRHPRSWYTTTCL